MSAQLAAALIILAAFCASAFLIFSAVYIFRRDRAKDPETTVFTNLSNTACLVLLVPTFMVGVGSMGSADGLDETPWPPALTIGAAAGFLLLPLAGLAFGLVRPRSGGLLLISLSGVLPLALLLLGQLLVPSSTATLHADTQYAWGLAFFGALFTYTVTISFPTAIAGTVLLIDHGRRRRALTTDPHSQPWQQVGVGTPLERRWNSSTATPPRNIWRDPY